MKVTLKRTSPNYRRKRSTQDIMKELLLAIVVLCVAAVAYNFTRGSEYGIHALLIMVISSVVAVVTEIAWAKINGQNDIKAVIANSFPFVTSLLFALTLPVGTPYYVVAVGSFVAIFFGKLIYGGFGHNIFNPALIGRCVVHLSFGAKLTAALPGADATAGATPLATFAGAHFLGELPVELGTLFTGLYPGALGETFTLLILVLGVVLAIRKVLDYRIPVAILGTTFVLGLAQGIASDMNPITMALAHIAMGGMALGAVFMATDPVTSPTSPLGKIIYGILVGFVAILIRVKANYPEGVLFAILMMNMFTPMIDNFTLGRTDQKLPKQIAVIAATLVIAAGTMFGIGASLEPVVVEPTTPATPAKEYEIVSKAGNKYVVSSKGFGGNMEVEVTFDGDTIVGVNVLTHNETDGWGKTLIEAGNGGELAASAQTYYDTIIKGTSITKDTLDGVDTATGATITSKAIIKALNGALEEKANDPIVSANGNTYVVRAKGFGGQMKVEVVMDKANSTVKSVKVLEHNETDGWGKTLIEAGNGGELAASAQTYKDTVLGGSFGYADVATIDTATGATITSKAILNAVQTAIDTYAEVLEKSANGVYTLNTKGFGNLTVEVKVNGSTVEYVKVTDYAGETDGWGKSLIESGEGDMLNPAGKTFYDSVLAGSFSTDSISGVDTKTGATLTAKGIMEAVSKAVAANNQ